MTFFSRSLIAGAAVAVCGFASALSAATVDLNTVNASWSNVIPVGNPTVSTVDGNPATVSWGTTGGAQSSYVFAGNAPQAGLASPFLVGTFTHNNNVIFGNSITGVDLTLDVQGTFMGTNFSIAPTYTFLHNETPNVGLPQNCDPALGPSCPDVVTIANSIDTSTQFSVNGDLFTLQIEGFSTAFNANGPFTNEFITQEGQPNPAGLYASIVPAPIPLPAAGWLMVAGLGGLAAMRRRKSKKS